MTSGMLKQKLENAKKKHQQDKKEIKSLFNKLDQQLAKYQTLRG